MVDVLSGVTYCLQSTSTILQYIAIYKRRKTYICNLNSVPWQVRQQALVWHQSATRSDVFVFIVTLCSISIRIIVVSCA